jgi:hypothetical protein
VGPNVSYFANQSAALGVGNSFFVTNTGNTYVANVMYVNTLIANTANVANFNIAGIIVTSNVVSSNNALVWRYQLAGAGPGYLVVNQGTLPNATLEFNSGQAVWQLTDNISNGLSTILTTANLTDNYLSTSITNVTTANALNAAYAAAVSQATGNAKLIIANSGSYVVQRQGLDLIAGNNITLNVSSNGSNSILTDATVSLSSNISGSVNANGFISTQQTLKAPREVYYNVGALSLGNVNVDLSQGSYLNVLLANNVNLTFQNCAANSQVTTFQLIVRQSGNGSNTLSYANSIFWSDNLVPVLTTTANAADVLQFTTWTGGSTYVGAQVYANVHGSQTLGG